MNMDQHAVEQVFNQKLSLTPTPLLSHYLAISTERIRLSVSLSLLVGEDEGDDDLITSREVVWDADTLEEILTVFSKNVPYSHFDLLLLKACVLEEDLFLRLTKIYQTTENLHFIQNAVHFFLRTPSNFLPSLLELLKQTLSPLAKAYLYLVIGLRGDEDSLKVLWAHWLDLDEQSLPKEQYNLCHDGLVIAIGDAYLQVYQDLEFLGSL